MLKRLPLNLARQIASQKYTKSFEPFGVGCSIQMRFGLSLPEMNTKLSKCRPWPIRFLKENLPAGKRVFCASIADLSISLLLCAIVEVGEFIKQDELVATVETDKIDVQINSPESGVIIEQFFKEGDSVQVGQNFFKIDTDGKAAAQSSPAAAATEAAKEKPAAATKSGSGAPPSSPPPPKANASKAASGSAPPPAAPKPTGSSAPPPVAPKQKSAAAPASQPVIFNPEEVPGLAPLPAAFRVQREVKMNRMRQKIAERLKQSQNTAASLTTFNEIDMSNLMEFRTKYKDEILKQHDVKLGFMSAFVKASVAALQAIPAVNAQIVEPASSNDDPVILYNDFCDISIAVATPKGLVTPVLRNVEKLNFVQIEKAIAEYGNKARENKISIEDMAGGTFTISNGGVFGSMFGTPIINLPQSGILGMHAVKDRPVVVDGKIEIRPMMYVALTYDHRIIDGREAVTFLKTVKEIVEDPRKLLLM